MMLERELQAVHETFHRLETRWHSTVDPDGPWHIYDPLPIALFLDGIRVAMNLSPGNRFLDCGCGIGTKMALMHSLGYTVSGIERVPEYVEAARQLIPEADVRHANIFDVAIFDADIVFVYGPSTDKDIERSLEQHVADGMTEGSILFRAQASVCDMPHGVRAVSTDIGVKV